MMTVWYLFLALSGQLIVAGDYDTHSDCREAARDHYAVSTIEREPIEGEDFVCIERKETRV